MDELDEIISAIRKEPKTYHPVRERDKTAWFPANEAASLVIQLRHIWDDLKVLSVIHQERETHYEKQLILKYVVIEVRSLIEVFDYIKSLDLYDWSRINERGNPEFLGCQLRSEYFKNIE